MENGKTITSFHILMVVMVKFREPTYGLVYYPPYSPDLAPSDFSLFKHFRLVVRTILQMERLLLF